jgi:hypothetical protein
VAIEAAPGNPARNVLAAGVTDTAVLEAVARSGYPLQTVVAEKLAAAFYVHEEWSYLDRDSKGLRTMDVLASRRLFEFGEPQPRARPELNLLIECKKSDLPFLFFATRHRPWLPNFPIVAGLKSSDIELVTDDDLSTYTSPVLHVLDLDKHKFVTDVPVSSTFSKCVRRSGGDLELSGDDSYNGIVLPLIKAAAHFEQAEAPRPTFFYFDAHLVIPVAVLDAPMLLLETTEAQPVARLTPWVRVARHEYEKDTDDWRKDRLWALDVVHVDYLDTYVNDNLRPFAEEFARRALAHHEELATGEGFASGLGRNSHEGIESRLKPRPVLQKASRGMSMAWRIITFPYWLWKNR